MRRWLCRTVGPRGPRELPFGLGNGGNGVPPTATSIFDFLHEHQLCSVQRYEVWSGRFLQVRHDLRTILVAYSDSGDSEALEVARRIRAAISEWLTTPIPLDEQLVNAIGMIGSPGYIEQRWGKAVRFAL